VRRLWDARGGGLYACGFVLTFIWLEATSLFDEVTSGSVSGFLGGQVMQMVLRFTVESLENTVRAFIWPVYLLEWSPQWGAALLVALYFLFPRFLKERLERWLFDDEEEDEAPDRRRSLAKSAAISDGRQLVEQGPGERLPGLGMAEGESRRPGREIDDDSPDRDRMQAASADPIEDDQRRQVKVEKDETTPDAWREER
jgi:hypothetical protein